MTQQPQAMAGVSAVSLERLMAFLARHRHHSSPGRNARCLDLLPIDGAVARLTYTTAAEGDEPRFEVHLPEALLREGEEATFMAFLHAWQHDLARNEIAVGLETAHQKLVTDVTLLRRLLAKYPEYADLTKPLPEAPHGEPAADPWTEMPKRLSRSLGRV